MASSDQWQQKAYWEVKPLFCKTVKQKKVLDGFSKHMLDNNLINILKTNDGLPKY